MTIWQINIQYVDISEFINDKFQRVFRTYRQISVENLIRFKTCMCKIFKDNLNPAKNYMCNGDLTSKNINCY